MPDRPDILSPDEVRQFWTDQALEHGLSPAASWSDVSVIDLEIRHITDRLDDGDHVLDAGCANGYSTVQYAMRKRVQIRGVDYIPQMIEQAKTRLQQLDQQLRGQVEFDVGDVCDLGEPDSHYDKLVVTRVLINLHDWEQQRRGLCECARVVKPGGLLLLSEATVQGWQKLNEFRAQWGLDAIPMPSFNQYVDEHKLIDAARESLDLLEISNFASTYYVGTRVLKPLLSEALGGRVNVADPLMHWNQFFSKLPAAGDYGTQKLFIFRKR